MERFVVEGKLWKWEGPASWYFLPTTKELGEELRNRQKKRIGWGSVPVEVTIGETSFATSLFPTKEGTYLLPIKAAVRKKEGLVDGSHVRAVCALR